MATAALPGSVKTYRTFHQRERVRRGVYDATGRRIGTALTSSFELFLARLIDQPRFTDGTATTYDMGTLEYRDVRVQRTAHVFRDAAGRETRYFETRDPIGPWPACPPPAPSPC